MHLLPPAIRVLADTASTALLASIWQGTLLVAAVALVLHLLRGVTAAARSAIWTGILLLVLALPLLSFLHPNRTSNPAAATAASTAPLQLAETWSFALLTLWLSLSALRAFALLRSTNSLRRILANVTPITPTAPMAALLHRTRRPVQLCISAYVNRPCVAGFLHPRILLPVSLLPVLSEPELEQIVLHELQHLRRRDHWTNLLQQASLVLCPLNPAVLWVDHRLAAERELACDDEVLRATRARKAYASCLARIAEHALLTRGISLALALLGRPGREPEIARRVHRILHAPEATFSNTRLRVTLGLFAVAILLSLGVLTRTPQLVTFAPSNATATPIATATAATASYTTAFPAAHYETAAFHPMVHSTPARHRSLPAPAQRITHRAAVVPSSQPDTPADPSATIDDAAWILLTPPHQPLHPGHRRLTSFQEEPPAYAAFRLANGWLIVPL